MDRPTGKRKATGALGVAALLGLVIAVFTTIGYAGSTAAAAEYAPQNTSRPTISGTPRQGSTLTANPGSYNSTSPISFRYQFRRCDGNGDNCGDIAGATSQTYTPTSADVSRRIRVRVTATNSTGSTTTDSDTTGIVAGPVQPSTGTISAAAVTLPNRLVVDDVSYSRSPLRSRDAVTMRVRVTDTNGRPVSGALVYVAGVPFSRIQQPPEIQTDSSGVASLTIQPTRLLPLRSGFLLTMFVRARKSGDDILAGVSTRRLVSLRTANPS
jgi:hypothetical protein